jgi:hypothetical protein
MGLPDTHDGREFRQYARLAPDGSVAAIVEVAEGLTVPSDAAGNLYVEVTDLHPNDYRAVRVPPGLVQRADVHAIRAALAADKGARGR